MSVHYIKTLQKVGFGTDKTEKYVGRRRLADPFTLERLAKEIAHETGLRQATCETVLRYMVNAIEDAIKDGRSVNIGIGTVSPGIVTKAADNADDVVIRRKKVVFRASAALRRIVQDMSVSLITDDADDDDTGDDSGSSTSSGSSGGSQQGGGISSGDDQLQP